MYMAKYIAKRVGLMLMCFLIIMLMCFVLIKMLPIEFAGGPSSQRDQLLYEMEARNYVTNFKFGSGGYIVSWEKVPIMEQLVSYAKRVLHGDFGLGMSMPAYRNKPVLDAFLTRLPPTILINIYSTLIGVPIGLGLGIYAALKKNKWQDHVINVGIIALVSVPSIVYALVILYVFCFKLGWFPLRMEAGTDYFSWKMFRSMLPAVFSLCLGSIAGYARFTRAELTEVLTSEFMLLARTKGLTRGQATVRHALRNAMVPIFPAILSEFVAVLSGSLVIENMFAIPGVGALYLSAINSKDYDFFMFLSGFYTFVGLAAGIVTDISYGIIDPRIRMGAR